MKRCSCCRLRTSVLVGRWCGTCMDEVTGGGKVKRCSRCHEDKPLYAFRLAPNLTYGLRNQCRACENDDQAARRLGAPHLYDDDLFGPRARIEVCICRVAAVTPATTRVLLAVLAVYERDGRANP